MHAMCEHTQSFATMQLRTGSTKHLSYHKHENRLFKRSILTNVTCIFSPSLNGCLDDFCSTVHKDPASSCTRLKHHKHLLQLVEFPQEPVGKLFWLLEQGTIR